MKERNIFPLAGAEKLGLAMFFPLFFQGYIYLFINLFITHKTLNNNYLGIIYLLKIEDTHTIITMEEVKNIYIGMYFPGTHYTVHNK